MTHESGWAMRESPNPRWRTGPLGHRGRPACPGPLGRTLAAWSEVKELDACNAEVWGRAAEESKGNDRPARSCRPKQCEFAIFGAASAQSVPRRAVHAR